MLDRKIISTLALAAMIGAPTAAFALDDESQVDYLKQTRDDGEVMVQSSANNPSADDPSYDGNLARIIFGKPGDPDRVGQTLGNGKDVRQARVNNPTPDDPKREDDADTYKSQPNEYPYID